MCGRLVKLHCTANWMALHIAFISHCVLRLYGPLELAIFVPLVKSLTMRALPSAIGCCICQPSAS